MIHSHSRPVRLWHGFVWVILATVCSPCLSQEQTFERPHVILILTDDQGYGDLSLHGNPHVQTPRMDALGRESVRFERFFVSAVCAPSRAGILTGRYPTRTGCHGVTHNREAMRPSEITIAEALKTAGYRTGCFGKWHNGAQYPCTPIGQGFDEFLGHTSGHINNYFDATLIRGSQPEPTRGYISDVLTDAAMAFIEQQQQSAAPFFCYLSYNAPHNPYQVPDRYYDKYRAAGFDEKVSAFYGMIENLDENLGRLLDRLDTLQLAENTLVLFLTDNGGTAGVRLFNAGMRGGKTSVHEGGSRVPLFMRWPRANWRPHQVAEITAHIDLYPTLLDLCRVPVPEGPPVDGRSLRPLLEESRDAWPERMLFTHNAIDETNRYPAAVRTQRYRLVKEIKGPAAGSAAVNNDASAGPWQLYDMQTDPGEKRDLAEQRPELVSELSAQYEAWLNDVQRHPPERQPLPVGYAAHNPVVLSATQARITPPLHYQSGPGFAHDWLTNWTDPAGTIEFDIDVAVAGEYAVRVEYDCPVAQAGAKLRVTAGQQSHAVTVPAAPIRELELPHRDEQSRQRYRMREWSVLPIGTFSLQPGRQTLRLEVTDLPGQQALNFKQLQLERLP